jgi:hypothetical protein
MMIDPRTLSSFFFFATAIFKLLEQNANESETDV